MKILMTLFFLVMSAHAESVDPIELQSRHFQMQTLSAGLLDSDVPRGAWMMLGASNEERELQAGMRQHLNPDWSIDVMLAGSNHDQAQDRFGSLREKGSWSGRLMRGVVHYEGDHLDLEFGRDRLGRWEMGESALAIGLQARPVDFGRVQLRVKNLSLTTYAAQLLSENQRYGFRRWLGGHRLEWRSSTGLRLAIGDHVLYTGPDRRLEPAYLNPFLPAFVANFEDVALHDSTEGVDYDNNMMFAEVHWPIHLGERTRLLLMAECLVDEFQMDDEDRLRMDDVFGVHVQMALTHLGTKGGLTQAVLSANHHTTWLYQHPSEETDWAQVLPRLDDTGSIEGLGHVNGGDLQEIALSLAWWPFEKRDHLPEWLGTNTFARVSGRWTRLGSVRLEDEWESVNFSGSSVPSAPVESMRAFHIQLQGDFTISHGVHILPFFISEHYSGSPTNLNSWYGLRVLLAATKAIYR